MKIIKKVLKIISTIIFAFLCVVIVLIFIYVGRVAYLTKHNRIGELKINLYTILTQSMYPNIKAGDVVITYKHDDGLYSAGDVITFVSRTATSTGITITHRIIKVIQEDEVYFYKTKGDNNNVEDEGLTPQGNVFGKVVITIPKVGVIQQFLVTKTGWVCAIVVPCAAIVIYDILKMFNVFGMRKRKVKEPDEKENGRYEIKVDEKDTAVDAANDIQTDDGRLVIPIEDYVHEDIDAQESNNFVAQDKDEKFASPVEEVVIVPEEPVFTEEEPPRVITIDEIDKMVDEAIEANKDLVPQVVTDEVKLIGVEETKQLEGTVVLELEPPKVYLLEPPLSEALYKTRRELLGVVDFDVEKEEIDTHYDGDKEINPDDLEYLLDEKPVIEEITIRDRSTGEERTKEIEKVSIDEQVAVEKTIKIDEQKQEAPLVIEEIDPSDIESIEIEDIEEDIDILE